MINNKENILNCIHSTNDINLILTHRSLYIIQKKFQQNKKQISSIYNKYGEYFEKEENLLIDQNYLPEIIKNIFNINKFEISDVASFKEALFKEMEYCKEVNTEQYILNEFLEFIIKNRKKYNYIYREKRNNSNFNLDDYTNLNYNIKDDWAKEKHINLFEDDDEENEIDLLIKDNNNRKITSSKFNNKLFLVNNDNEENLKINLELIKQNKEGINNEAEYSYSESSAMVSGRRELSSRGKDIGINYDSAKGTHRSDINTKRKDVEKANKSIIPENEDDEEEKESNNKTKEIKKKSNRNKKKRDKEEEKEEEEEDEEEEGDGEEGEEDENEENEEEEDDEENENKEKIRKKKEKNKESNEENENNNKEQENRKEDKKSEQKENLDDLDLVNIGKSSDIQKLDNKLLFSNQNKMEDYNFDKKFYSTNYDKNIKNIKSLKYFKYYIYAEILPLIIADFISDQRNLYVIIDHGDDLRDNLTSIFDSEILYKLGEDNFEEVLEQILNKITEYKKSKNKVEQNIENYEKLSQKLKSKNQDITYISITLQKLNEFLSWLNTKIFTMQNDVTKFQEFKNKKKEEQEAIFDPNHKKFAKERLREKKEKLIEDYKQLKKDLELRKFLIQKKKRYNKIVNKNSKINLQPIVNSTILNNNTNNISKIEKDNSNNLSINSNEISADDYKNTFLLSEQNLTIKKNQKIKNFNYKTNFENILTEKKVLSDDEDENKEKSENKNKEIIENINNSENFSDKDINNNELKESNINENNDEVNQEFEIPNTNSENKLNDNKNIKEENKDNLKNEKELENEKEIVEIKQNRNQLINKNKKIKLMLKSSLNRSIASNNKNNNKNYISQTIKNQNKIHLDNEKNNIINTVMSADKFKTNPKTTKSTKKKINYILKKIIKPEKPLTKDEIREKAIKDIFNFYSSYISNSSLSFEAIKNKKGNLNLNGFCKFCNDFKLPLTKDKILSIFNKSISIDSRLMTLQEFKLCLISISFEINKAQIDEIDRSINIFIGKVNQKNKEKSRFAKVDKKEKEKNKEVINEKLKLIETYQNKSEEELIEDLFKFMEIDEEDKYKQKMKGGFANEKKEINLPKLKTQENKLLSSTKTEHSKIDALMSFNKSEIKKENKFKKLKIGMRIWVKGMVEKERDETPEKEEVEYVNEEIEQEEEKEPEKEEEKKDELPVIESKGMALFSRNKKKDEKKYLYEKFL